MLGTTGLNRNKLFVKKQKILCPALHQGKKRYIYHLLKSRTLYLWVAHLGAALLTIWMVWQVLRRAT